MLLPDEKGYKKGQWSFLHKLHPVWAQLRHRYFWSLEMIWIFSHGNVVVFFVAGSFSNCYYVCTTNDMLIWTRLVIDKTPRSKSWHHFQFITSTIQHIQGIVIRSDVNNMFLLTALFLVLKSNMLDEICNGFSSALHIFCAWMNNDNVDHSHNFHQGDISQMGICSKCFSLPAFYWGNIRIGRSKFPSWFYKGKKTYVSIGKKELLIFPCFVHHYKRQIATYSSQT